MSVHSVYNKQSRLARAFPAPTYLTTPAVGIDISDYAIKFISLERKGGGMELGAYGKIDLPVDTIERGEIKDPVNIVKLLSRLKEQYDFEFAHIALPEEHAYLFQMDAPRGSRAEVEQVVEFHLKENVPIGAEEAVFDYSVIGETKDTYHLNVSVYPDAIASQYVNVVEDAGYKLLSIEIEGQATARTLVGEKEKVPTLIIDIGRNDASLSISTGGVVTFTANLDTGGDYFTRALSKGLDISFQEGEKLKRKHGFRDTKESEIVFNNLLPVVGEFAETIRKHLMYWQMHVGKRGGDVGEISRVMLVGGNANMAGLAEYLEATLEVSVGVGCVWKNIFLFEEHIPDMPASNSLEYATAIGLALRSIMRSN